MPETSPRAIASAARRQRLYRPCVMQCFGRSLRPSPPVARQIPATMIGARPLGHPDCSVSLATIPPNPASPGEGRSLLGQRVSALWPGSVVRFQRLDLHLFAAYSGAELEAI